MISLTVGGSRVDFLPVVNGLVSERPRVEELVPGYDAVGVSLGPEDIEAIRRRGEISEEYDFTDLEATYAHYLSKFGEIDLPSPALTAAVDSADAGGIDLVPLDMDNEEFSEMYCEAMSLMDVLRINGLAKKAVKKKFDMSSPEAFVDDWDSFVNRVRGNLRVSEERERRMAERIINVSEFHTKILIVAERERVPGIVNLLKE